MPPTAEISEDQHAQRRISFERIERYKSSPSPRMHGSITKELGRVAGRDPQFALELAVDLEPEVKINGLAIIGRTSGDIGPLDEARDIAQSEQFSRGKQSEKLAVVAEKASGVDAVFAFETARGIPLAARRADALLKVAEESKRSHDFHAWFDKAHDKEPVDNNFSMALFMEMFQEADRTITENNLADSYRNRKVAQLSAEIDLRTTYDALSRNDIRGALNTVAFYIKDYIEADELEALDRADPEAGVIVEAFRARAAKFGEEDPGSKLDPINDAALLLDYYAHRPEVYSGLLSVIRKAAMEGLKRIAQDKLRSAKEAV